MIQVRRGIRSEEVRTGGEHVLFVEGSEDGSLDQAALRALLSSTLRIETMGPAYSVRSAAQALARHHPKYYFLIDRDHYDDEFVERSWQNFPDPETDNLLVWRRRELENYFLDPAFLAESVYCEAEKPDLTTRLVAAAQKRLFLDVANTVISSIREDQKRTWIEHFTNPRDFTSKGEAVDRLITEKAFAERSSEVSDMVSNDEIAGRFDHVLQTMTGGGDELEYGTGRWVEMVRGKKVLAQLLNSGGFEVRDTSGQRLNGKELTLEVVKELAVKEVHSRPSDLTDLQQLIQGRVGAR